MTDRQPKRTAGEQGQSAKRKASVSSTNLSTGNISSQAPYPIQRIAPTLASPRGSFQIPPLPNPSSKLAFIPQKVAIPRLRKASDATSPAGSSKLGDKHRVNHACEPCRHRKTKCSGERPTCKHCEDFKISCVYADGKRARVKKEYDHMVDRIDVYEQILQEVLPQVNPGLQARIRKVFDKYSMSDNEDAESVESSLNAPYAQPDSGAEIGGESQVSAAAGSTGSLDRIKEDFNRSDNSRATGYMGKLSEITWMHRLRGHTDGDPNLDGDDSGIVGANRPDGDNGLSATTYHCDDLTVLVPDQVEPLELPPKHVAEFLLQTYLETVHPGFPIIGKLNFTSQARNFLDHSQLRPGNTWLAILNLIFAIAAKYAHLVESELRGDERDHLVYFTRARMLATDGDAILAQPDLQRVQVTGLMSFYLMSINQINRSWTMCGISLRYSVALGLHLRNDNAKQSDANKEVRYRVWWALYGLERILGVMTGRPTSIVDSDCITPMPLPIDEEVFSSPNISMQDAELVRRIRQVSGPESPYALPTPSSGLSPRMKGSPSHPSSPGSQQSGHDWKRSVIPSLSLYLLHKIQIHMITNEVLTDLYRPSVSCQSWAQIQTVISSLESKLEKWRFSLPPVFDFAKSPHDQQFLRERMSLGFFYYSTRIIIHRPCLCRVSRRIPHESNKSKEFNRYAATTCVQSARGMLDLLPDAPNPVELYKVSPWWCLTHYLMQASTILMLELFFRAENSPNEAEDILGSAKKAVYWLHQMSKESLAAQRAWSYCNNLLRKVAPMIGCDADDLPASMPQSNPRVAHRHTTSQTSDKWGGPQQFARQFPGQSYYGGPPAESEMDFQQHMSTSFDEYLPFNPSMAPPSSASSTMDVRALFPTSSHMDTFGMGPASFQNQYFGQDNNWDPGDSMNDLN